MEKYIAFFRGINVGGKNRVKMAELKQLFVELGFQDVKTYIQSGNVIFAADQDKRAVTARISEAFATKFGFPSAIVIRTRTEIEHIMNALPFQAAAIESAEKENPEVEHVYIYLSDCPVDRQRMEALCADYAGKDQLHITEQEIYLLCFQSIRDSKLAALLGKLPQSLTARNIKTMNKIKALL